MPAEEKIPSEPVPVSGCLFTGQADSPETGNDGDVEAEIVPPAAVEGFVYPYSGAENSDYQRDWGNPAVPDSHKKARGPFSRQMGFPGQASGEHGEYQDRRYQEK